MVLAGVSLTARLCIALTLVLADAQAIAQVTYDDLTPKQKAWVDAQIEATRCKPGLFGQYYQECILDHMPSAKNPFAAGDVMRTCRERAPCSDVGKKKSGFFSNTTAADCFRKYGYNVTLPIAAGNIRAACYDLYPGN